MRQIWYIRNTISEVQYDDMETTGTACSHRFDHSGGGSSAVPHNHSNMLLLYLEELEA